MSTMETTYGYDRSRITSCCGQPVLLEHRAIKTWGGAHPVDTIERCSGCKAQL